MHCYAWHKLSSKLLRRASAKPRTYLTSPALLLRHGQYSVCAMHVVVEGCTKFGNAITWGLLQITAHIQFEFRPRESLFNTSEFNNLTCLSHFLLLSYHLDPSLLSILHNIDSFPHPKEILQTNLILRCQKRITQTCINRRVRF
ncbi:hypothetical protein AOQ84DRAFT_60050 [Glonium stellatum]|uniref:Uncharacterized protein n=1 Tax=Glonium stellatum TaxID=574774 RepID=A0A8E2EYT7_9PEZI|nr:hypothetical protein AOQ84DRAFT_60050 [Glonium stellatum]